MDGFTLRALAPIIFRCQFSGVVEIDAAHMTEPGDIERLQHWIDSAVLPRLMPKAQLKIKLPHSTVTFFEPLKRGADIRSML